VIVRWIVVLGIAGLLGCESSPTREQASINAIQPSKTRNVLVVSVAANEIHRVRRGLTVLGNESNAAKATDTRINQSLEVWFSAVVTSSGHRVVRTNAQEQLGVANKLRADAEAAIWKRGSWEGWEQLASSFKNLANESNASTIALIRASQNGDSIGGLLGFPRGVGVFTDTSGVSLAFAMIDVILIDASSGKPYEQLQVLARDGMFKATPTGSLGRDFATKPLSSYSAADYDQVISALAQKTKNAFELTLPSLDSIR
jgi:hypothetical protein